MKTVWIDLMCLSSAFRLVLLSRKEDIGNVYYCNVTMTFSPFVPVLSRFIGKPVEQVLELTEGDYQIGEFSLYELIQMRITEYLNQWVLRKDIKQRSETFCRKFNYDIMRYEEHIREQAYPHIFRPVEIQVLSEKYSDPKTALYIIRKTPFQKLLSDILGKSKVIFYRTFIAQRMFVADRPNYLYDASLNGKYFSDRMCCLIRMSLFFIGSLLNSLCYWVWRLLNNASDEPRDKVHIGVELLQSRIRFDQINDLYWLQESDIERGAVWGIQHPHYDDKSLSILHELGVKPCRIIRNPIQWPFVFLMGQKGCRYVSIKFSDFMRSGLKFSLLFIPFAIRAIFVWDEQVWIRYQRIKFSAAVAFWKSVYRQLNIKILWNMLDIEPEKLTKLEALERLDGIMTGSHWSNYPIFTVLAQNCYDVLFTWGPHFLESGFFPYSYLEAFQVGYPLDYVQEKKREAAQALSIKHDTNFVIAYFDNQLGNDIAYTIEDQVRIYGVLISVLKKYDHVIVLLKPKKEKYLNMAITRLPELQHFIDKERIKVIVVDPAKKKVAPAAVGMAAELVIGLGISTAATECFFAKKVSWHIDVTGFKSNRFAQKGLNKVVFRDLSKLEDAIEKQIRGEGVTYDQLKEYYQMIDPFQDGQAYKRTGFVLRALHDAFLDGLNRRDAVKRAKEKYHKQYNHVANYV